MRRTLAIIVLAVVSAPLRVSALPQFARRERVGCETCHTVVPRLNRFGYEYRRAGYRIPDNLGKEEKPFELGDFFSARVQGSTDVEHLEPGGPAGMAAGSDTEFSLAFQEFSLFPLTGSWGRYFSSRAEIAFAPGEDWEVEAAWVRFNYGQPDKYVHVRFGVMHPFEGYGASDDPVGVCDPLIFTSSGIFNQDTFFSIAGFNQMGVEAGYTYYGFSATVTMWNGILVTPDGTADAAQGGALTKPFGSGTANTKDIQVFLNQLIGEKIGLGALYYHGWTELGKDPTMPPQAGNGWRNSFDRMALFVYDQFLPHLGVQGGGLLGVDHFFDAATGSTDGTFWDGGFFGEVLVPVTPHAMGAVRYDWFDPSSRSDNDVVQDVNVAFNYYLNLGLQFIADYRFLHADQGAGAAARQDHLFELRISFVL